MQPFEWIGPLKEAVLLVYFLVFCLIAIGLALQPELQRHNQIPFLGEEEAS